ncbi:MAG: DNA-directed DNA polymerase eta rad30 [Bogoriella megaspora]|nr:MAG: DNA-directed DNA polymerase eta rad30 [Bogoriella megaspora]
MSSSIPALSSPPTPSRRRKSRFTYRHLHQLSQCSPSTPLRIIAHIDLDAFYAQCEQVRLDLPTSTPLAVQQWQGLIAINYPARAYGLNRHVTVTEAKKLCPDIVCQHVATWKEGDDKWAYREDAFRDMASQKVSLDPYRRESRRILGLIKDVLPKESQRVEKASVDEVFLDLSAQVHGVLLERFPEALRGPPPYDDPSENLPRPSISHLDWEADALVDLDDGSKEEDDPDWDDVAMLVGSEIVRKVRKEVWERLKYTCSGGVAKNKMLAKLGSGHKKPNQQTVVRNRAVGQFLSGFKFTKIRNLGGKLGDEVVSAFNTDTVSELLEVPIEQLKKKVGDDTGAWLYGVIRGEDNSEVNPRTQIKSMLSAKSFRPSINTMEQAVRWLRIFAADIFSRLVEEGVLENKRKPKTINLHHRQGGQMRSKQAPIPQGKVVNEVILYDLAKNLMAQIVVDGRAWPCANLSLSVGGFEDGVTGNRGIGSFLVRGEEAKSLTSGFRETPDYDASREISPPTGKRRKLDNNGGSIGKFLTVRDDAQYEHENEDNEDNEEYGYDGPKNDVHEDEQRIRDDYQHNDYDSTPPSAQPPPQFEDQPPDRALPSKENLHQADIDTFFCARCNASLLTSEKVEHEDWHFAQDLQAEERNGRSSMTDTNSNGPARTSQKQMPAKRPRGRPPAGGHGGGSVEKGQKKLAFS